MFLPFAQFGAIHDHVSGSRLDATTLAAQVAARTSTLTQAGIGPGAIVAITHGGTARFFVDLFSVWSAGATAACLDPTLTNAERDNVIAFCKPALVIDEDGTRPGAPAALRPGSLDDPALLLFTSGTTGAPKGVALSFRALFARIALNIQEIGRPALAATLVTLPTHFGHGLIGNALTPLWAGGTIHLVARGLGLAQSLGKIIDANGITFMTSVPSLWQMALRMSPPPSNQSLKRVHVGSAPLSAALWSRIAEWCGCETVNCYGITETSNWVGGASSLHYTPADGLIGKPWGGSAAVRRADGTIAMVGEGEVLVQTPALMLGYHERPDLTAAVLKDGWYATGDVGEIDAEGVIRLTGRAKDEINRGGFKVQPAEIDMLLERHPDIAEACVFGIPDQVSGEIVAAAVKLAPGTAASVKSLRDWCLQYLRREATPERWFIVDDIPKTSRGKVSRDLVRRSLVDKP